MSIFGKYLKQAYKQAAKTFNVQTLAINGVEINIIVGDKIATETLTENGMIQSFVLYVSVLVDDLVNVSEDFESLKGELCIMNNKDYRIQNLTYNDVLCSITLIDANQ